MGLARRALMTIEQTIQPKWLARRALMTIVWLNMGLARKALMTIEQTIQPKWFARRELIITENKDFFLTHQIKNLYIYL